MPFDVLPQETKTRFQHFAEAMLRGCAVTRQIAHVFCDGQGGACALGALFVGMGEDPHKRYSVMHPMYHTLIYMRMAYREKYGCSPEDDNDTNGLTREQIAARIAAL